MKIETKKAPQGFWITARIHALIDRFSANNWLSIFYPRTYWALTYQYFPAYLYCHGGVDQALLLMELRVSDLVSDSYHFPFKRLTTATEWCRCCIFWGGYAAFQYLTLSLLWLFACAHVSYSRRFPCNDEQEWGGNSADAIRYGCYNAEAANLLLLGVQSLSWSSRGDSE